MTSSFRSLLQSEKVQTVFYYYLCFTVSFSILMFVLSFPQFFAGSFAYLQLYSFFSHPAHFISAGIMLAKARPCCGQKQQQVDTNTNDQPPRNEHKTDDTTVLNAEHTAYGAAHTDAKTVVHYGDGDEQTPATNNNNNTCCNNHTRVDFGQCHVALRVVSFIAALDLCGEYLYSAFPGNGHGYAVEGTRTGMYFISSVMTLMICFIHKRGGN